MENLVQMFNSRVRTDRDKNAYYYRKEGRWTPMTWGEADREVDRIAAGLISMGVKPGDRVCILGNTRLEWALCDLAVLRAGGVGVGIYQTLSGGQCNYILEDSGATGLIVENNDQLKKLTPQVEDLQALKSIIVWDGEGGQAGAVTFEDLKKRGDEALGKDPEIVSRNEGKINHDDTAIIIYTSGTTGPPKGACISHKNVLAEIGKTNVISDEDIGDTMMFFLPLSHVGERVAGHYMRINRGVAAAFVSDMNKILDDMAEIRPTFFGSVPRIFEKAYAKIQSEVQAAPPMKQKIFRWAENVGRDVSRHIQRKEKMPMGLKLKLAVADKLVFKKVRDIFGGRVKYFFSSAAPIAVEILEFFHACGMLVLEGYGQTEMTCFCTLCSPEEYRFGSVGKTVPGVELKLAEDGEIMVKGDIVFKGYLNQPELTAQTITPDGWIYSGDLGRLDEDGFLWITGRKKEIIVTSGGKNVTPSNIEGLMKNHPLIEHVLVHGDRRKYLTALVSISTEQIVPWAKSKGIASEDYGKLVGMKEVRDEVQAAVDNANRQIAKFETVKKFYILPTPMEVETGELTPTMKVRRKIVEEKYRKELDSMYSD